MDACKPNKFHGSLEEIVELYVDWKYTGRHLTLDETSKILGISRSTVKAIECRALAKLKAAMAKYGIKDLSDVLNVGGGRTAIDAKDGSGLE